jgi:hypothetical protein
MLCLKLTGGSKMIDDGGFSARMPEKEREAIRADVAAAQNRNGCRPARVLHGKFFSTIKVSQDASDLAEAVLSHHGNHPPAD